MKKTENSATTYYIRTGLAVLAEYNANDDLQAEYIYGIDGMLTKFAPNQGHTWYYKDHLGSTREMGSTTMLRDYYPFGETLNDAGDETNYQFTGKELDNHTEGDLYYFGARYYDPKIGRWLTPDPLLDHVSTGSNFLGYYSPIFSALSGVMTLESMALKRKSPYYNSTGDIVGDAANFVISFFDPVTGEIINVTIDNFSNYSEIQTIQRYRK